MPGEIATPPERLNAVLVLPLDTAPHPVDNYLSAMNSRYTQFGATTALVALAVVVSLGSVTDVQAGAALAHLRPEARVQVANEGQAVAEFLSRLSEAVRLC